MEVYSFLRTAVVVSSVLVYCFILLMLLLSSVFSLALESNGTSSMLTSMGLINRFLIASLEPILELSSEFLLLLKIEVVFD